jgi:hypothetical protein
MVNIEDSARANDHPYRSFYVELHLLGSSTMPVAEQFQKPSRGF